MQEEDHRWMQEALALAAQSARAGEVPVGAVLVKGQIALAKAHNAPISQQDPSAHAEMLALRAAAKVLGNYRLLQTTLYVTLEPCMMCVGALLHARVQRLVFGAYDPKAGAVGSQINLLEQSWKNHQIWYKGGVLAEDCGLILKQFFKERR